MPNALAPVFAIVIVVGVMALVQWNLSKDFDYTCDACGFRFSPPPLLLAVTPHRFGGTKLLRCPRCGEVTWAVPVRKRP